METTFFNRHISMDSETRTRISDLITDLQIIENCPSMNLINMLYGSFDGYNYSKRIKIDPAVESLKSGGNSYLANEILDIASIIEQYPRTEQPNGNVF